MINSAPKISLVVPVFNEENNLDFFTRELTAVLAAFLPGYAYEIIFVNDGSTDASWQKIGELAKKDQRVKALSFTRNFGQQMALTAGLKNATGDFIVTLDCDLQDPPSLIPALVKKAERGANVVYARRLKRNAGFFKKVTAAAYYALLSKIANVKIPPHVGDFRLISRKVLVNLNRCPERNRYLRGLVAWLGFDCAFVDFERPARKNGRSNYSFQKMLRLALDGLTGFSVRPLRLAKYLGLASLALGLLLVFFPFSEFKTGPLWPRLIIALFIFNGLQFLVLWIIGEYVGRLYDEEKKRPLYIIKDTLNFEAAEHD